MKGTSSTLHFGKPVHDNWWGAFLHTLGYKLANQGEALVRVDRMFPSSKKCSSWGICEKFSPSPKEPTCAHNVGMLWIGTWTPHEIYESGDTRG